MPMPMIALGVIALPVATLAQDKHEYTLLNPTPREQWRPLSADRPDVTESPYTVDAGAWQIEASFVEYARTGDGSDWSVAPTNLKLGLLNDVDIQLVLEPWLHTDDGESTEQGFGDTQVRLKINLWGNDQGDTAMGFMPFIKIPTASDGLGNDHVEGGLIFPFSTRLTDSMSLGLMLETDFVFDEASGGYETEFVTTAALGIDITDKIGAYVEGVGIASTDADVDYRGLLGVGGTYSITPNVVLDAGVNVGLTGDVDDVKIFTGITWRF